MRQPEIERAFVVGFTHLRKQFKMSAMGTAARLNDDYRPFTAQMLSHWESGRTRITLADALAMVAVFNTDIPTVIDIGQRERMAMAAIVGRWPA